MKFNLDRIPKNCVLQTYFAGHVLQDVKRPAVVLSVALVHVKHLQRREG